MKPSDSGANEKEYLASLKVLNETVTTWITDHVKKNPCCVLTPIFQDYEKHLKDLESKRSSSKENKTADTTKSAFNIDKSDNDDKKFQFGVASAEPSKPSLNFFGNGSTPAKSMFAFTAATSTPLPAPTFSFGGAKSDSETIAPPSTFSFKTASTSSTGTSPPAAAPLFSFAAKPAASTPAAPAFSFGFAR